MKMEMETRSKYWWLVLLKGIVLILLSLFVFRNPAETLVGLALYIGISFLISGILLAVFAFTTRKIIGNWGWRLAEGIIDILLALILLSNPGLTAAIIPFIAGLWIIFNGVILSINAFDIRGEESNWWIRFMGGILAIILGFFITNNPMVGAVAISTWIGIGFLLVGIIAIIISFRIRNLAPR